MEGKLTVIDSEFAQADATMLRTSPPSMVERMTRILEAFDASIARLTLEEVTFRSGLPRSTVHRILDQLVRLDWLEHGALGYGLGSRALGLGGDIDRDRLRECAAPHLHELAMQTGGVVHLDVLDGTQEYCLDKVGGAGAAGLPTRVGGRTAAYATAGGKAMLATLDPEQIDSLYPVRLAPCTHHTITDRVMLHQELNRVRKRHGIAFDREESIVGIGSVGAPLRGTGGIVASVSLAGGVRAIQLEWMAPLVADFARKISSALACGDEDQRTRWA